MNGISPLGILSTYKYLVVVPEADKVKLSSTVVAPFKVTTTTTPVTSTAAPATTAAPTTSAPTTGNAQNYSDITSTAGGTAGSLAGSVTSAGVVSITAGGANTEAVVQVVSTLSTF